MSRFGDFLLEALSDEEVARQFATLIQPHLRPQALEPDRWLSMREAAEYLGMSITALHKLTAAREIPFSQRTPCGKCWFQRSDLDEWRR